jgi:phosphoserine/homoserine phosphotransferase
MKQRIAILARHGLGLPDIQRVIAGMTPPGAAEFLGWLRERLSVVIPPTPSFAAPLMRQLGIQRSVSQPRGRRPRRIVGYRIRLPDQKRQAVKAFQRLNLR